MKVIAKTKPGGGYELDPDKELKDFLKTMQNAALKYLGEDKNDKKDK